MTFSKRTGIFFYHQQSMRLRDFPEALEGILERENVFFYDAFYPSKPRSSFDLESIPLDLLLKIHTPGMIERVKKAGGFLSIGLQTLEAETAAQGHPVGTVSAALIQRHPLADIFRVGYGRALELKWRVRRWMDRSWFAGQGLSLTFWGEDWLGVLGGLLIKKPMFYDNFASGRLYRDFGTIDELRQTAAVLDTVIACDDLFSQLTISPALLSARRFLTFKNLVLTLWALDRVGCRKNDRFLTRAELRRLFETIWQGDDRPHRIAPAAQQAFLAWLCGRSGLHDHEVTDKLGPVLESLFSEIEEEYGQVDSTDLDPRLIHLFLVED